jgi:kynurenine formamidase
MLRGTPPEEQLMSSTSDWFPSRYGADDRLGALNNLSPQKTLDALKLVRQGKVYSLAVVSSASLPTYPGRTYEVDAYPLFPGTMGTNLLSGMDDRVMVHMGAGTQIDGFGHVGINERHYNGVPASQMLCGKRAAVYGMQDFPPVVTRGVLLDIAAVRHTPMLEAGFPINRAEIQAAMKRQQVALGKGDVVLLHTGWMAGMMSKDGKTFVEVEPGLSIDGAVYLADLGVVAIGADNTALEHVPFADPNRPYEVHQILLPRNGIFILEYVVTEELIRDQVHEFLFVLSPPRFDGTVQVLVNPVAIA